MLDHRMRFLGHQIKQAGIAAVEFALVLPLLLLILFGIVEFGVAFYDQAVITNASREGARAGVVLRSPPVPDTAIEDKVTTYTAGLITFSGAPTVVTTVTRGLDADNGNVPMLTVRVDYNYGGLLLGPMLSVLTGPILLSATTRMDFE